MRILLSSNPYRDKGLRVAIEAQRILQKAGAEAVLCMPFLPKKGERVDFPRHLKLGRMEEELSRADVLVCFGGDGTILHAAGDAAKHNVPVMGINMGSVGFMAELERGELSLLTKLAEGDYRIEERMMLQVRLLRGDKVLMEELALNDAVISKGSIARVAEFEVRVNDLPVSSLTGDGVIICSPTGSTAYSMSAGGPIVEPTSKEIIITPVCAHQLAARTMVLGSDRVVTVQLPKGSRKLLNLAVDGGKVIRMTGTERVEIRRADKTTKLIRLTDRNFYQIINQKLGGSRV